MEKVRQEKKIINFISQFNNQKKIMGCICSGAQLLISAKVVKGRKITPYYSMEDDLVIAEFSAQIYLLLYMKILLHDINYYRIMGPWMKEILKKF